LLDHGWIHCDVKPENLILSDQGTVTLIDLELAQQVGRGQAILMGTPEYSAPEQALGDANLDHRADIYSLGATLFLLLTGQPPYSGLPSAILLQHQLGTPPDPRSLRSDLPPRLAEVVQKMMAKRPEDRYRAWTDVKFALRPWLVSIRKY
jgi:serine/threonine-protein kinase